MDPEIVDQMRALGDCLRRAALTFAFTALREGAARSDTLAAADHAALVPFRRRDPTPNCYGRTGVKTLVMRLRARDS